MSASELQVIKEVNSHKIQGITPLLQQYLDIKARHQDYLVFFRLGDFYELFFDDAIKASSTLDIVLTRRGNIEGQDVPMCGVPFHSVDSYIERLIKNGFKIAICEQMEDPIQAKKRGGAKAVVRREVTRIITPGTITEENLLDAKKPNFLSTVVKIKDRMAIAWVDISTGEFSCSSSTLLSLASDIAKISPKEIIVSEEILSNQHIYSLLSEWKHIITTYSASFFETQKCERKIKSFYGVVSLESFGNLKDAEISACGALLEYIDITQKGKMPWIRQPKTLNQKQFMVIDAATRKNLEIFSTLSGEYRGSLINVIDKTITSSGARLLYSLISAPLIAKEQIEKRLDAVEFFIKNNIIRIKLKEFLKNLPDIERSLSRLSLARGGPRDLLAIREGLIKAMSVSEILESKRNDIPQLLEECLNQLLYNDQLIIKLKEALQDEVPMLARDGGFIKEWFNPTLDEYRSMMNDGEGLKLKLRDKYRQETGIQSLKIGENNIIGYYIEVTSQNLNKVPDGFVHRQTMAGAIRYTTSELKEIENKIINASGLVLNLELELFNILATDVLDKSEPISVTAKSLATLDVIISFAELAVEKDYVRPSINDSVNFYIEGGRHPVVEELSGADFKPNTCKLDNNELIWLLTGPNMAGKSTFLRQNAIIAILAQAGCYVPAKKAEIGVINRIFSRIGASDDLARGRSTFLVEMVEAAVILNQADSKSLVILDEIGRGTATYDGLSIAWAVLEYLHEVNKCRTLFATHYHELTKLSETLKNISCYNMKIKEWDGEIIFLHEVVKGAVDKSYGIYVAKLAGLPKEVIDRANEILINLDKAEASKKMVKMADSLPLFSDNKPEDNKFKEIKEIINDLDVNNITPKQAHDILYKIKGMIS